MPFLDLDREISMENMSLRHKMEYSRRVILTGQSKDLKGLVTPGDILDIINLKVLEAYDRPLSHDELNECIESTRVCYRESEHFKSILAKASNGEEADRLSLEDWIILGFVASPEQIKTLPVSVLDGAFTSFIETHPGVKALIHHLSKREVPMEEKPKLDRALILFVKNCAALALVHPDYLKQSKHANDLMTMIKHFIFQDSTQTRLNLEGAHFRLLEDKNIPYPDLKHAILQDADLSNELFYHNASFRSCDLREAQFAKLKGNAFLKFEECDFRTDEFTGEGTFFIARFNGSNFSKTQLNNMMFAQCSFDKARLDQVRLLETSFETSTFDDASICDANFSDCVLNNCEFTRTDLNGTNLSNASMDCSQFHQSNLSGANLSGAILINTCLKECNLTDTILQGADFTNARLSHIDLSGKNLDGVILGGAELELDHVTILGIPKNTLPNEGLIERFMNNFYQQYGNKEETKQCIGTLCRIAADELSRWIVNSELSLQEKKELLTQARAYPAFSQEGRESQRVRFFKDPDILHDSRRIIDLVIEEIDSKLKDESKNTPS